jgi:CDP-diacylglycerol--glycerol-3-phosphate 3-phosphatidyltransferase
MSVVSASFRSRVRASVEPIARIFGRVGLTPNALTVIGLGIAIVGAWLAASESWLLAGLVVAFGAIFDLFDGALARATGRVSKFGAFLDSSIDRAGEAVVYVGIAFGALLSNYEPVALLALTAMASGFMVSYVRARAEGLGFDPGKGLPSVGLAPREVRMVILVLGLLLSGQGPLQFLPPPGQVCIDQCNGLGYVAMPIALALITLLAVVTTIQRILFTYRQSKTQEVSR